MRYLIHGNGWLGNMLSRYLNAPIFKGWNFDIESPKFNEADVIINTIAKTDIDWCEKHKKEAEEVNVNLAWALAQAAYEHDKRYVFFSSGCIFESKETTTDSKIAETFSYHVESDVPNPQCFYAKTKVLAEEKIKIVNPHALIIRPRLPLSEVSHPRNTIDKLLKYDLINTNQESVTVVEDMFPVLKNLMEGGVYGVFHLVNAGTISPSHIALMLGHQFKEVSKFEQDERLSREGRAKRVTTYLGSERIELLPDIRKRITRLVLDYEKRKTHADLASAKISSL